MKLYVYTYFKSTFATDFLKIHYETANKLFKKI